MTREKLLPGHLSRAELHALLEPVQHFQLLVADVMTLRFGRELISHDESGFELRAFCLCNSMGAGGGIGYGNSEMQICIARVRGAQLPHTVVLPRTLLNRLRTLLARDRVRGVGCSAFRTKFLVRSREADAARAALSADLCGTLARHALGSSLEYDGERVVLCRAGGSDATELAELMESAEVLARCLARTR